MAVNEIHSDSKTENQSEKKAMGTTNPHAIARISVEGLFGRYDYDLTTKHGSDSDLSRLLIMYGENGAGKTTLLKMIYHLLSSEGGGGHRTFLAQTRFKRFSVELNNGTILEADRKIKASGGSLLLTLRSKDKIVAGVELKVDDTLTVKVAKDSSEEERFHELLRAIATLNIRLHYLSDDRRHQGELLERKRHKALREYLLRTRAERSVLNEEEVLMMMGSPNEGNALQEVMARVVSWVQHQVRRGATKGQGNVYDIYSKVISDIAHSEESKLDNATKEAQLMIGTLRYLETTSRLYSEYGLTLPLPVDSLIESLQNTDPARWPIVYNVMKPYVDGIKARLAALSDIYNTISNLITTVNSFYRDKHTLFNVDKGFKIYHGDEPLDPSLLSSGEKQLFLLLCNTILARSQASIFLIDEPELSLNVKWQRQLVQAVLNNTEGSNVQFVMSTHSMELITLHRSNVVRLAAKPRISHTEEIRDVGGEA